MTKCPEIDHNISIHYNNQTVLVGPCCHAVHTPSTGDILNHPRIIELRQINQQDLPLTKDCRACTLVENSGGQSRRTSQLEFYQDWHGTGIRGIDLHLGNLCNLKCVICGPDNSTSWISDYQQLGLPIKPEWQYRKQDQYDVQWLSSLESLEIVHMWGGEPLASDAHIKFLRALKDSNRLAHCRINYNTNGTFTASPQALELWKESKLVELYFSVDDIGQRFEYQRTGATWDKLEKNLLWYYNMPTHNHLFYFTVSWSLLNVYYLPELIEWKKQNLDQNRFGDHTKIVFNIGQGTCALTELPEVAYRALEQKFKGYPELQFILNSIQVNDQANLDHFITYIKKLDQIRNSSYQNAHPEWSKLIGL